MNLPIDHAIPLATDLLRFGENAHQEALVRRYHQVRQFTHRLCQPLMTEDYVIQAMPDVSPPKWHLAHTSWFFENFILAEASSDYRSPHTSYAYLFNSYYVAVGERHSRPKRGLLSRPTIDEVYRYRAHVDQHMTDFLQGLRGEALERWFPVVELGLHHEQQHQELLLTDVKYNFACNPLRPAYKASDIPAGVQCTSPLQWVSVPEGVYWIGHDGKGFSFDNEFPRHRSFVERFELASRLITNGEYLAFMADRGYERPELWLSMGWDTVQREAWRGPALLGTAGWHLVDDDACRDATRAGSRTRLSCQLLRSRCICALGRCSLAHRGRMGSCGDVPANRGQFRRSANLPSRTHQRDR